MKIGVVVHGPNIIDSGYASEIIDFLSKDNEVYCRLGGTMGRTAVIDASLEDTIDISHKLLPSESLSLFANENVDVIFLLNYGKSSTTGHVFGYKVFNHYLKRNFNENIPLIQIERPGEDDGSIVLWNLPINNKDNVFNIVSQLKSIFNIVEVTPSEIEKKHFSVLDTVDVNKYGKDVVKRKIHGVSPGENILVNGTVIGKSESESLILISKDGIIVDIIGGKIKQHGVDKLGKIDLKKAIVKTGLLRRAEVSPRIIGHDSSKNIFKVGYLDHAAEDVYSLKDMDLIVTVGDDTTLLASDILFRFKIPIIGITDGDLDKVVEKGYKSNDSIIFQVQSGYDDKIGHKIFSDLFNSNNFFEVSSDSSTLTEIISELSLEIMEIIKYMKIKYIIK
ncbi:DUF2117 domain-containing protein [Methanobrevibacter wolinii]|uniref:DUF2117 domain-containing protein n=1 Tax=Methanobrevibacter wolinii TaxID=190977 RepID=UPI0005B25B59|nr:DUF2117 domain-containing protein [Methanobrevibacter wolinii]MDD5959185.1 DUF2117 domain-containing protein [Methanobrevibacter wolinii]